MRGEWTRREAVLALAAPVLAGCEPPAPPTLTVYAAASLKDALDEVNAAFAAAAGGVQATASYAASSTLARQVEQGAPADVVITADAVWMDYLHERGLIRPATRRDLLANRLALIAPAASTVRLDITPGMPLAAVLGPGRLALAAPDVPAGRYARAALTALGVWSTVEGRTALGENVRTTLQFVARGEAPLGVVYDTDALAEPRVRIVGLFPSESHPKIIYPVATVAASGRTALSEGYIRFLVGAEAMAIFRRRGFTPA